MGITLMGGVFAWLFITQAVDRRALPVVQLLPLWHGKKPGAVRYTKYIKYIAAVIAGCFLVWFTLIR
jgi:hypothetical protein